jgi:hypothetical protein
MASIRATVISNHQAARVGRCRHVTVEPVESSFGRSAIDALFRRTKGGGLTPALATVPLVSWN